MREPHKRLPAVRRRLSRHLKENTSDDKGSGREQQKDPFISHKLDLKFPVFSATENITGKEFKRI